MRSTAGLLILLVIGLTACAAGTPGTLPPGSPTAPSPSSLPRAPGGPTASALASDPLHAIVLRDVRSGAEFSIGQLAAEKPVLLEAIAIWCTNCRSQQREVVAAHALADFHGISLDVDPNERATDLADYAVREGFDWRFAVADADLARMLVDRFGAAVLNPPSMPKILFRTDGSIELIGLGSRLSAAEVAAAVGG